MSLLNRSTDYMILIMFPSDLSHVFDWGLLVILRHDITGLRIKSAEFRTN